MADIANEIDNSIRRIFDFNIYLTSDEILRLEEIRKRLYVYDLENYNSEAALKIGAIELYPVNPSISYMRNNLSELYELFKELQDSIFKNTLRNREIQIDTVQHYYYSEEYEKAIRAIEKGKNKYPKDINLFAFYEICSLFKLNKKDSAYRKIEKAFESKPHLVSSRDFINELLPDEKIKELLHKYFSEEDISKFQSVIETEQLQKVNFIKNAKELEGYYKQKSEKVHNES